MAAAVRPAAGGDAGPRRAGPRRVAAGHRPGGESGRRGDGRGGYRGRIDSIQLSPRIRDISHTALGPIIVLHGAADSITSARTPELSLPVHTGYAYGTPQYTSVEFPSVPIGRIAEETLTRGVLGGASPRFGDLTAVGKEAVKETHERFGEDDGGEDQAQTPRQR